LPVILEFAAGLSVRKIAWPDIVAAGLLIAIDCLAFVLFVLHADAPWYVLFPVALLLWYILLARHTRS
jgi:hypothetical protein